MKIIALLLLTGLSSALSGTLLESPAGDPVDTCETACWIHYDKRPFGIGCNNVVLIEHPNSFVEGDCRCNDTNEVCETITDCKLTVDVNVRVPSTVNSVWFYNDTLDCWQCSGYSQGEWYKETLRVSECGDIDSVFIRMHTATCPGPGCRTLPSPSTLVCRLSYDIYCLACEEIDWCED